MRESRTYGSVRGALSNERPYRDRTGYVRSWPIASFCRHAMIVGYRRQSGLLQAIRAGVFMS